MVRTFAEGPIPRRTLAASRYSHRGAARDFNSKRRDQEMIRIAALSTLYLAAMTFMVAAYSFTTFG